MKKSVLFISVLLLVAVAAGIYLFYNNPGSSTTDNPNQIAVGEPNPGGVANEPSSPGTAGSPKSYDVQIKGFAFSPSTLTIKVGDSITWTNADSSSHTVTSDSGSELSSGTLSGSSSGGYYSSPTAGGSYSHTFTTAGTYSYHCGFHPNMKATVIVE